MTLVHAVYVGGMRTMNKKDLAIEYIFDLLRDRQDLLEERKLDPNYIQDQDLQDSTESELAQIINAQRFMDLQKEENI